MPSAKSAEGAVVANALPPASRKVSTYCSKFWVPVAARPV
jgi:hypothetical protein